MFIFFSAGIDFSDVRFRRLKFILTLKVYTINTIHTVCEILSHIISKTVIQCTFFLQLAINLI